MQQVILLVDDDARVLTSLAEALASDERAVVTASDARDALAVLAGTKPDVVVSDVRMPGMDGLELLRLLRERVPDIDVVMMTAFEDLETVATAMREGATDFLVKPLDLHQLRRTLARVQDDRAARARRPSREPATSDLTYHLVGHDPRIVEVYKLIGQVSGSRTNVVVRGESGTGKELIARAIHAMSPYAEEPFVAVNCTSLPSTLLESELFGHMKGSFTGATADRRGRFALAGRGTIFLDEIGDTTTEFQAKLLRVLQEHEYYPVGAERPERMEARVVAATHRDLEALVGEGSFREDLYYRLRVVEIFVPPLRERLDDIPALAQHLLAKAAAQHGQPAPSLHPGAIAALQGHDWPGNVRELENCLTRAMVLATGGVIHPDHLALERRPGESRPLTRLADVEKEHVTRVLRATGGQKARAARILGVSRPRLDRLIERHDLGSLLAELMDRARSD
ncbi:MAG TPA: sigma-54 dependent transcriptional regulator [Gemmatimonadales bacterium]|nr:sigma-54 dependent transcriptional regulator [Gemmatimonadales bacterium]